MLTEVYIWVSAMNDVFSLLGSCDEPEKSFGGVPRAIDID